jgi:hypothetical protein
MLRISRLTSNAGLQVPFLSNLFLYLVKVVSRPNAISSRPCPARSYIPPRFIKFGHGRNALMGIHENIAPIPPGIL